MALMMPKQSPEQSPHPRVQTETDRRGKKAICWTQWKAPQQRPLTMHNSAWCTVQSFFFFFYSLWDRKRKKNNYWWDATVSPPRELLGDDGMQGGIWGAQVERKRQSVTSRVARRKISQANGVEEFTARTGSILAKWDAVKGCQSGASVPAHVTEAADAQEECFCTKHPFCPHFCFLSLNKSQGNYYYYLFFFNVPLLDSP